MTATRHPSPGISVRHSARSGTPATNITPLAPPANASEWAEVLRDGSRVAIRLLRKGDAALERDFIKRLSPASRRMRFLGGVREPSDALVRELTDLDYQRKMAFVAIGQDAGKPRAIGVSRYSLTPDGKSCECAVTVSDEWQGKGLGTLLMRHLIDVARQQGIRSMFSIDAVGNSRMHELARDLGFVREGDPDNATQVIHRLAL